MSAFDIVASILSYVVMAMIIAWMVRMLYAKIGLTFRDQASFRKEVERRLAGERKRGTAVTQKAERVL